VGLARFYGGTIQLLARMWESRNRNVFGATAFSSYGGFWLGLGTFVTLLGTTSIVSALKLTPADINNGLAWFLLAFAIFNTYMLLWSLRVNVAVFGVFLAGDHGDPARDRLLPHRPRPVAVDAACRRLGRIRHRRSGVVRVRGRRRERRVAEADPAGRPAALGPPADLLAARFSNAAAHGGLGWPR